MNPAEPDGIGRCENCGATYPVRLVESGTYRVIGTDGDCRCGSGEFTLVTER